MNYKNKKHKQLFTKAIRKQQKEKKELIAAIYLLTADFDLWRAVQFAVLTNVICFEEIRLHDVNEDNSILFCAAKDLYLGSDCITLSDLADKDLVSKKNLMLLNNAILIRRYGLDAWKEQKIQMNL